MSPQLKSWYLQRYIKFLEECPRCIGIIISSYRECEIKLNKIMRSLQAAIAADEKDDMRNALLELRLLTSSMLVKGQEISTITENYNKPLELGRDCLERNIQPVFAKTEKPPNKRSSIAARTRQKQQKLLSDAASAKSSSRRQAPSYTTKCRQPVKDLRAPAVTAKKIISRVGIKSKPLGPKPSGKGIKKKSGRKSTHLFHERLYCICHRKSIGGMIMCDNTDCKIKWYHFKCVNLKKSPPIKEKWFCSESCRSESLLDRPQ